MARKMPSDPIPASLRPLAVSIADVSLWPGNYRDADVGAIADSLNRFGQQRPIIVQQSSGRIIAGNGVYRAASSLGWTEIAAIPVDLNDRQAKAYLVADNRTHQRGSNDEILLAKMLGELAKDDNLEGTGYDLDDIEDLLRKVGTGQKYGKGDPDASKDVPAEPWVKPGQIFALGPNHRITCGDGHDPDILARLLDNQIPDMLIVQAGKDDEEAASLFDAFAETDEQLWFSPIESGFFKGNLDMLGRGSWLVWDKQVGGTHRDHAAAFELIWSRKAHAQAILSHIFVGAADGQAYGGPDFNERPSALFTDMYERWTHFEALVLDPFALGATALLGAERCGRRYFGAKSSPSATQALLEKWAEYAGEAPVEVTDERRE